MIGNLCIELSHGYIADNFIQYLCIVIDIKIAAQLRILVLYTIIGVRREGYNLFHAKLFEFLYVLRCNLFEQTNLS